MFDKDPFTPQSHKVWGCASPPPVVLTLGMKVVLESVKGELKSVYGMKRG